MPHYHRIQFHIGPSTLTTPRAIAHVTHDLIRALGAKGSVVVLDGETYPDVTLPRVYRRPSPLFGLLRKHDRSSIVHPMISHLPTDERCAFEHQDGTLVYSDATDTYTYGFTWRTRRAVAPDVVAHRLRSIIKETAKRNGRTVTITVPHTLAYNSHVAQFSRNARKENA